MSVEREISDAIAPFIGDDPGPKHAAETAQWACEFRSETFRGNVGQSGEIVTDHETFFDIASVSKLFTATAAAIAVDQAFLHLDDQIGWTFPDAANGSATLRQVLNHSSGYPAWDKYYERLPFPNTEEEAIANRDEILRQILETPATTPPGTISVYSDLGYILLGHWLERSYGQRLDEIVATEIFAPLEMTHSQYVFCAPPISPCVRTEIDTERRSHVTEPGGGVCGVVHDENCYIQGGVAGHAGVFSTASDLVTFGKHVRDIADGESGIVTTETMLDFWNRGHLGAGHHVVGWDTPSGGRTSVGSGFGRESSYGHLGFTGTSLWLDRETRTVAALLTNRVFPSRENPKILDLRIAFHEAVQKP